MMRLEELGGPTSWWWLLYKPGGKVFLCRLGANALTPARDELRAGPRSSEVSDELTRLSVTLQFYHHEA